jgi:hypothetical protein
VTLRRTQQDTATIFSWTRLIGGRLLIMRTSQGGKLKRSHTHPSRRNFPKSSETLKTFDMMRGFQLEPSATLVRRRVTRLNHFHNTFRLASKRPSYLLGGRRTGWVGYYDGQRYFWQSLSPLSKHIDLVTRPPPWFLMLHGRISGNLKCGSVNNSSYVFIS